MEIKRHLGIFIVFIALMTVGNALAATSTAKSKPVVTPQHSVSLPSHVVQLLLNSYHGNTDMDALTAALHPSVIPTAGTVAPKVATKTVVPALKSEQASVPTKPLLAGQTP